jgi:Protein of unknown function (DUF1360)
MTILIILFAIILTEALTQIITKSEVFKPIRKFFFDRRSNKLCSFVHDLLDCGYCTSVWAGWFVVIAFLYLNNVFMNVFFAGIILHRLSNVLHFMIDRIQGHEPN